MARGSRGTRLAEGIWQDQYGIGVTVSIGSDKDKLQREKRFDRGTPLKTMKAWQDETKVELRKLKPKAARGTLNALVPTYLEKIKPLLEAGYEGRVTDINMWLPRFGDRRADSLETAEITDQLLTWRKDRSASSCNHRRDALSHFYHWLDGHDLSKRHKMSGGPVEGAIRFDPPDPTPRARTLNVVDDVLALLPEGEIKTRLTLLRWTGMRPSQMGRLTEPHFDFQSPIKSVVVPRGKRGRLVRLPLSTSAAVRAARAFVDTGLFGTWKTKAANEALAIACAAAGVAPFTVYQIKHSVGSHLRRQKGVDLADIQDVFGHTDPATSAIYAPPVDEKQIAMFRLLKPRRMSKPRGAKIVSA